MFTSSFNTPSNPEMGGAPGFGSESDAALGELFDGSSFSFENGPTAFSDLATFAVNRMGSSKRKESHPSHVESSNAPASKKLKPALGGSFANVIEEPEHSTGEHEGELLMDDDILALSDALTDALTEEDSYDEDSNSEEEEEEEEEGFGDDGFGDEDSLTSEAPDVGATGKGVRKRGLGGKKGKGGSGGAGGKKARGNYACSKCGMPKRGHSCAVQPRVRRRGSGGGGSANGSPSAPGAAGAQGAKGAAAEGAAEAQRANRVLARQRSDKARAERNKAAKAAAAAAAAAASSNNPDAPSLAPNSNGANGSSSSSWTGQSQQPAASKADMGTSTPVFLLKPSGRADERKPKMVNSKEVQCEMNEASTVRELYLDAQGFPESYAQGLATDPNFKLSEAKTVTVSRPPPKSYKPTQPLQVSCAVGPDGPTAAAPHLGGLGGHPGGGIPGGGASAFGAASGVPGLGGGGPLGAFASGQLGGLQGGLSGGLQGLQGLAAAQAALGLLPSPGFGVSNAATNASLLQAAPSSQGGHPGLGTSLGGLGMPSLGPVSALTLNHLAILMNSYQQTLAQATQQQQQRTQQQQQQQVLAPAAAPPAPPPAPALVAPAAVAPPPVAPVPVPVPPVSAPTSAPAPAAPAPPPSVDPALASLVLALQQSPVPQQASASAPPPANVVRSVSEAN